MIHNVMFTIFFQFYKANKNNIFIILQCAMAWLSDLAGKAENLLNKIDQNTAAVLSKDKNDVVVHDHLTDVTWEHR